MTFLACEWGCLHPVFMRIRRPGKRKKLGCALCWHRHQMFSRAIRVHSLDELAQRTPGTWW